MIRVEFVDPGRLPGRVAAVALDRPDDLLFVVTRGLTAEQVAYWITRLGGHVTTREAADAALDRYQTIAEPPLWV